MAGSFVAVWEGPGVGGEASSRRERRAVARGGQVVVPGGGGQGLRGGPPPRGQASIVRGGSLKVTTTQFREGYLRKNGVPYSEQATITEYFHRLPPHPNGDEWLHVTTIVEDPVPDAAVLHEHALQAGGRRLEVEPDALRDAGSAAGGRAPAAGRPLRREEGTEDAERPNETWRAASLPW